MTPVFTHEHSRPDARFPEGDGDGDTVLMLNEQRPVIAERTDGGDINDLDLAFQFARDGEQDQGPNLHDLLRLDLREAVELHFRNDARGGKAQEGGAAQGVEASVRGILGEEMTTVMLGLMLAASAADLASTEYALASGYAAEGNPLMQSRPFRIATSLAVPVVAYLLTRKNPRLGKWVCIVHVGMHGTFTVHNIYTGVTVRWR